MNFVTWPWQHWAKLRGEAKALRLSNETLDWQTLCQRVDVLAGGFWQQGVREGQGVALRARNSAEAVLCWLALLQCGARVLPLNPQLPDALLMQLLPGLTISHALALGTDAPVPGFTSLNVIPGNNWQVNWQPDRLASMTLTSGSSGLPKAAAHTSEAHLASAAGVLSAMNFGQDDSWLLSLPLYHVSGQGILWRWLLAGGRMAVRDLHPLGEALEGCTHASLVPTQLWRLLEQSQPLSLREVLLGGAAIPVELTEAAQARGVNCWCGYGLTELASTVCAKRADGLPDVGEALPGREVKIVDEEVWIRATSLASGYWQQGKLVPLLNKNGWFSTRDRGVLNGKRLTIIGRLDNQFFSGGEGIQPEEIERVLAAHPAVKQAFVVPIEDAEFGHRPVAVVEADDDFDVTRLEGWVQGKLARFQQPVRWLRLSESLKEGGIKISRKAVQVWVAGSQLPAI
ncbi:o-succinylbenzoate--CoA ligase [Enterobacteriaceae bacterium H20N1]|uniref:O-succinylbenzoate--CoA ligase n=1 Tax=Dryocola boscaweniae TaxID=2925397 RepID=A0A9X2W906_9ENTR|nr:o-succinylbenzoate--CoA ligase [Dryocola boscaweniae]MCT4702432.1 o-succinylbenzoate--CoA ligase [Dryocola boscaweniae]MCT4716524.1 o-succinylbenzoate--CoA ligase [Dryocola boscaweniae]MCT4719600.1 o-succinylbenzoate--CoA ligase [Dryocola boscaweniae]